MRNPRVRPQGAPKLIRDMSYKAQFVASSDPLPSISRVIWARLGAFYLALGALAWGLGPSTGPDDWWIHGLWCLAGLAGALPVLIQTLRVPFAVVLSEHRLMFLAAFSFYFLFGAALLAFGPDSQIEEALRYYPVTAPDAMRVNAVNGLGFGLALCTSSMVCGNWIAAITGRCIALLSPVPTFIAVCLFLLVGSVAYVYTLSFDLGLHEGVVPGIVRALGKLSLAAVLVATAYRGAGESWLRALAVLLVAVLTAGGLLQFNKTEVLVAIGAFMAGLALRFNTKWLVPAGVALIATTLPLLGALTAEGRTAVNREGVRTLAERWNVVRDEGARILAHASSQQYGWWNRLSYTVPQVAALDFQDAGQGGNGFSVIGWTLIPRIVDADKPEMTITGRDFHAKITGQARADSSTGQGIFASGYYHGGWWGLAFASIICGWIVALTSSMSRAIISTNTLLLFPFCLLGLYIAFRIDGDFVSDYVGSFMFIAYPILALSIVAFSIRPAGRRVTNRVGQISS